MVVLGGIGSVTGSVVAAIGLTLLKEVLGDLKDLLGLSTDPRMVIFSSTDLDDAQHARKAYLPIGSSQIFCPKPFVNA